MATFDASGSLLLNGPDIAGTGYKKAVRTAIIDNMMDAIAAITANFTYNRTVRTTSTVAMTETKPVHDTVYLLSSSEAATNRNNTTTTKVMTARLALIAEDRYDLRKAIDDLVADVTRAISADETRGTLAISTDVVRTEDGAFADGEPTASAIVDVEIHYRHVWGNPYRHL